MAGFDSDRTATVVAELKRVLKETGEMNVVSGLAPRRVLEDRGFHPANFKVNGGLHTNGSTPNS